MVPVLAYSMRYRYVRQDAVRNDRHLLRVSTPGSSKLFSYATRGGAQNVAHTRFSYIPA